MSLKVQTHSICNGNKLLHSSSRSSTPNVCTKHWIALVYTKNMWNHLRTWKAKRAPPEILSQAIGIDIDGVNCRCELGVTRGPNPALCQYV